MQISRPTRGFCFGPFELDSDTGELRYNGVPVHLQPQPLQVLQLLLENAGKLVSREQLQQQLWPEETFVEFEVGLNQAIKKLRDALVDSSHKPLYIETIPRRGYRFIFPVEIIKPTETRTEPAPRVPAPFRKRGLLIFIVLLFIVSTLGLWQYRSRQTPLQPHQPIAVVPFRNLTQDPQVEWLSTGFPEMLTTNLAQMNGMDVLSPERLEIVEKRLNKEQPKMKATTPEVVKEAGARVYVSGSLVKISPAKIVVQIRMQDVDTGKLLFTDNLEAQNPESIFQLANAASARLGALFLAETEAKQQQPSIQEITTANPEAYRHYLAGNDYLGHALYGEADREWREATRLDPQFALAHLRLLDSFGAVINPESDHLVRILNEIQGRLPRAEQLEFAAIKTRRASDIDGAIEARERILAHSPRDSLNRIRLSQLLGFYRFETDRAAALLRKGLPLDPRDSGLWNDLAYAEALRGDESAAMEACRRQEALTGTDDPTAWSTRGDVLFTFGHNADALAANEKVIALKPDFSSYWQYLILAAIHADEGRADLAEQDLGRYAKLSGGHRYAAAMPVLKAQILEARGNPEGALALYRTGVINLKRAGETTFAYLTLQSLSRNAFLLGHSSMALSIAKSVDLDGRELLVISWLQAIMGQTEASENSLERYTKIATQVPPRIIARHKAVNQGLAALSRGDSIAALQYLPRSEGFFRAHAYFLAGQYTEAESSFRQVIFAQRLFAGYTQLHQRSPFLEGLSHFHLGQIYAATGKRDDSIREYQTFLSHYKTSRSRIPEIAQARQALQQLSNKARK